MPKSIEEEWLIVDEKGNAIDYLEVAARFLGWDNDLKWKWVAIALHGALYGFAILALKRTAPKCTVIEQRKGKEYLIDIREAIRRCQDTNYMNQFTGSKVLKLSLTEKEGIEWLIQECRNNFAHFQPSSKGIHIPSIKTAAGYVLKVIQFLAFESGNVLLEVNEEAQARKAIETIRENL
ncbi:MAG: hypothetical protein HYX86_03125 [Chloroflexi bacterium]|nr:hypothetical protein [Chloroflexota bacterium]